MKFNKVFKSLIIATSGVAAITATTVLAVSCSNTPSIPEIKYFYGENIFCNIDPTDPKDGVNRSKQEIFKIFEKQAPKASGEAMTIAEIQKTIPEYMYMDIALSLSNSSLVKSFKITNGKTETDKFKCSIEINWVDGTTPTTTVADKPLNYNKKTVGNIEKAFIFDDQNSIIESFIYQNTPLK